jgi:uncharacterized protein YqeY
MSVKQDLSEALKQAMKARDQVAMDAIRAVQSPLKLAEKESHKELDDSEIHAMIQKAVKQRRDSIASFKEGGREDLAAKEQAQIDVLEKFLPAQLSRQELASLVDEAVAATGAASIKEMGKVMAWLMPRTKGKADGGAVNGLVKAKLGA